MTSGGFSLNNSANSANHFWCSNTNGNSNFGYGETDQGYKLAVNGTGLFSGKLRVTDSSQSDMDGTVLNDGAIQTNGGISAVKDINSGANINAYGNLNAYGTVRVAGGTPTQLMTRDGGYVEVGSVGGTSGNGSFTIIGSSNFSSATVQYHNYTLVGNIVTESIRISGNVTSSGYFHVEVTPAFTPKILTVPYAGTGVVDNGSLVPATAWTGTGFPSMIRCVCYNGAASTSHSVSIVIQYEKQ